MNVLFQILKAHKRTRFRGIPQCKHCSLSKFKEFKARVSSLSSFWSKWARCSNRSNRQKMGNCKKNCQGEKKETENNLISSQTFSLINVYTPGGGSPSDNFPQVEEDIEEEVILCNTEYRYKTQKHYCKMRVGNRKIEAKKKSTSPKVKKTRSDFIDFELRSVQVDKLS